MSEAVRGPWENRSRKTFEEFRPFSPAVWQDEEAPAVDYIVQDCFVRGTVAILAGDGGLGKSLLMQQLITACWAGRRWLGHSTQRVKSLAVFCEDDRDELHRRQEAINRHYNCDMRHLDGVAIETRAGRDCVMMNFPKWGGDGEETPMFHQVRHAAKAHGAQLVVLDTRADVFGGNEIDRVQPRSFIRSLRRLALELQGVVILTEHPSNEGLSSGTGKSGSTAWHNSVRSRLYLTHPKKKNPDDAVGNERLLKTMKNNSGRSDGRIKLEWQAGVFVRIEELAPWTVERDELEDLSF